MQKQNGNFVKTKWRPCNDKMAFLEKQNGGLDALSVINLHRMALASLELKGN